MLSMILSRSRGHSLQDLLKDHLKALVALGNLISKSSICKALEKCSDDLRIIVYHPSQHHYELSVAHLIRPSAYYERIGQGSTRRGLPLSTLVSLMAASKNRVLWLVGISLAK